MWKSAVAALALAMAFASPAAADPQTDQQIAALAHAWDHAQFEITGNDAKLTELQRLDAQSDQLARAHAGAAEPLVWEAIILSSEAGVEGGLGALGKVNRARDLLLQAERINPNALGDGSIYSSLGSLYYQVPGFPLGFGNRDRAREYLERALRMNPNGIEPNYFMADFLIRGNDYAHAATYLERAQAAPPRPGREVADNGRRRDIAALMAQVRAHAH
ncbi:MAG TPA: tetratricopeptide repeat protein [Caulobacterales bacterium]|nr:tetratricopeptide repeat protein [Caulobacterales bacterium]